MKNATLTHETSDIVAEAFGEVAAGLIRQLLSGLVSEESVKPWVELLNLWQEESAVYAFFDIAPITLKQEVQRFLKVVMAVVKVRATQ